MNSRSAALIQILKKRKMLAGLLVIGAGLILPGAAVLANPFVLDWRVIGFGQDAGTCETGSFPSSALSPSCTSTPAGSVQGTHIGSGTFNVSVTTGSDNGGTSDPNNHAKNSNGGLCLPANGSDGLTTPNKVVAADGSTISFSTVGWLCEEGNSGSSYHYNGTYRITGGTGRFSTAAGGGSLTYTVQKPIPVGATTNSYLKIDGTINF
jgi:hypothetical protein